LNTRKHTNDFFYVPGYFAGIHRVVTDAAKGIDDKRSTIGSAFLFVKDTICPSNFASPVREKGVLYLTGTRGNFLKYFVCIYAVCADGDGVCI
jgi:hypothetical protein